MQLDDVRALIGILDDETVRGQLLERFADDDAADVEGLREIRFRETLPGI